MYDYLEGKLVTIYPNAIVVDCNGVGFLIQIANPFSLSSKQLQIIKIFIHQVVREDAIILFGFQSIEEKDLFLKLISVTGIGPKSALSILANGDMSGLVQAIETNDSQYLTKFPGVGKKTAGQLILDLKGKLGDLNATTHSIKSHQSVHTHDERILNEAMDALIGLGYSQKEIQKIKPLLKAQTFNETSQVLKYAFKLLLGK